MFFWIGRNAAKLFRSLFFLGALGAILSSLLVLGAGLENLVLAGLVCLVALALTIIARIVLGLAKKKMARPIDEINWGEMSQDQCRALDAASRIALSAQAFGLLAAAFGFGWMFVSMAIVIFGRLS